VNAPIAAPQTDRDIECQNRETVREEAPRTGFMEPAGMSCSFELV